MAKEHGNYFLFSRKKCCNLLLLNFIRNKRACVQKRDRICTPARVLNVSGTSIDNHFLIQLSQLCCRLYCLNISKCFNVTNEGISQASFCLALINMSYCLLGGESVIHAIREYGCTLVCVRGMYITSNLADTLTTLFPDILEIGIPVICVFFFEGSSCPNVFCWCGGNDVTTNLLTHESWLNPCEL